MALEQSRLRAAESLLADDMHKELGDSKIVRRFFEFHAANPRVFELLYHFTLQRAANRARFGIAAVFERVRWEVDVTTYEDTGLKLNNNYRAYYARLLSLYDPALDGLFATRTLGANREAQIV